MELLALEREETRAGANAGGFRRAARKDAREGGQGAPDDVALVLEGGAVDPLAQRTYVLCDVFPVSERKVRLADGKMVGAEALIRWRDAELGDISPAEFVPIAEESGLIVGLGDWVIREACRHRQEWRALGIDVPPVSLNMAGVQLRQLGCVDDLLDVLGEYGVATTEIEIEVTETGLLDTSAVSRENLVRMRNAGIRIALDDFGVGFSSLAHLRDLPIHRLKIDRSFTVECMRDARTLTIVKAVVEMARSLGITVTAEGIETQAQQTWMQHLGCDSAQGYLFARPMTAEDFLKLFVDRRGAGRLRPLNLQHRRQADADQQFTFHIAQTANHGVGAMRNSMHRRNARDTNHVLRPQPEEFVVA